LVMICRIVKYSADDARINEAFEEAMLLARHEEQTLDTVRIWQNPKAVVLSNDEDSRASLDEDACKSNEVTIVRRGSSGKTMYHDQGILNLTYVIDQKRFFPDTDSLVEVYERLWKPAADVVSKLSGDVKVPAYGKDLVINERTVAQAWIKFYHNLILFQLSISVDANQDALDCVLKHGARYTSLRRELTNSIGIDDVGRTLIDKIAIQFGVSFEEQNPSPAEKRLAERLFEVKYSKDDWNLAGKAPLSLKDALMEVYVAYPPTTSCREIIENIQSATRGLEDRVETRIWMRGRGLDGKGKPPGVPMSAALMDASKKSIIPAIIINGQIAFSRHVASAEDVRSKILQTLGR
jgi:lipoate-protein ligase A